MRAVNLVPADQRRGGIGAPGRSGSGVYVLLGALAVMVVAAAAYVLVSNSVTSRKSELATVNRDAAEAQARAAALRPYKDFATLSQLRVATVSQLAASRFDWERVMRQLSRALPGNVWLTSVVGTVAPGVALDGSSSGNTGSLRSALQVPAVEIVGCTESQAEVSRVMARLRLMHGVTRVSLASSEKTDSTGGSAAAPAPGSGGGGASTDCRNGNVRFPQFQLVVFFEGAAAPRASSPAPGSPGTPAPGPEAAGAPPAAGGGAPQGATPASSSGGTP